MCKLCDGHPVVTCHSTSGRITLSRQLTFRDLGKVESFPSTFHGKECFGIYSFLYFLHYFIDFSYRLLLRACACILPNVKASFIHVSGIIASVALISVPLGETERHAFILQVLGVCGTHHTLHKCRAYALLGSISPSNSLQCYAYNHYRIPVISTMHSG